MDNHVLKHQGHMSVFPRHHHVLNMLSSIKTNGKYSCLSKSPDLCSTPSDRGTQYWISRLRIGATTVLSKVGVNYLNEYQNKINVKESECLALTD